MKYIRILDNRGEDIKELFAVFVGMDYINGKQSAMWYKYNIPTGYTCIKNTSLIDYLDPRITVIYSDHDGLRKGETYGPIVDDNTCDREG